MKINIEANGDNYVGCNDDETWNRKERKKKQTTDEGDGRVELVRGILYFELVGPSVGFFLISECYFVLFGNIVWKIIFGREATMQ